MTKLKNGAKVGVFIVPSNLAIFWRFWKFCFARNIGAFWKFWFVRNYLCPPLGYLMSPPTWQFFGNCRKFWFARNDLCPPMGYLLSPPTWQFFGDFWKICFARNFLWPSFQRFWRFSKVFVLRVIICAFQFCGVSCVLHAALAACVCCSIFSISRMMCGIRNSLRMFW
jgi:hypothetical protein